MRYENWDVLLFPGNSKVPVQEFKTQCAVAQSKESPSIANPSIMSPQTPFISQANLSLVPVLTTYIPSLPVDSPFRVSIHSWEKPRPSRFMDSIMQPDDTLLFMAQVYVDGAPVSTCVFGQRTSWPHVVDFSPHINRDCNQELLRFPPFHHQMLEQSCWGASDLSGRIVIMITEGFARPTRSPPIERVRDVIAFSFLHAPLQILELSNVAWPNGSMWAHAAHPFKYYSTGVHRDFMNKAPEDFHAHSPTKHEGRPETSSSNQSPVAPFYNPWAYRGFLVPPLQWPNSYRDPRWSHQEQYITDPVVDAYAAVNYDGARSYRDDISMSDWKSASSSSRAISGMTGMTGSSYEHSKQPSITGILGEDQYGRVFRTFSPPKEPVRPIQCPMNYPSLPTSFKLSTAVGARPSSQVKGANPRPVSEASKDMPPPGNRDVSRSGTQCYIPFQPSVSNTDTGFYASPGRHIRGKKEITILDDDEVAATVETPRRASTKANCTPTKRNVRSGSSSSPIGSAKRIASVRSGHAGVVPGSKPFAAVITPTKSMNRSLDDDSGDSDDQIQQIDFDDFMKSKPHLGEAGVGVTAVE